MGSHDTSEASGTNGVSHANGNGSGNGNGNSNSGNGIHHSNGSSNGASNGASTATETTIPAWVEPDLPRLLTVYRGENYTTRALSRVTLPPDAVFARITTATTVPSPQYTTVQAGPAHHIELNSDLVYINHSCVPNLIFDMERWEVRVSEKGLKEGDELTFFYPSTEWKMERGFECNCGESSCLGYVEGAKDLDEMTLRRFWLSRHIRELKEEQVRGRNDKLAGAKVGTAEPLVFRSVAG